MLKSEKPTKLHSITKFQKKQIIDLQPNQILEIKQPEKLFLICFKESNQILTFDINNAHEQSK